jgi:hypothetical protein
MKFLIFSLILFFVFIFYSKAENDTLVITLKNNQVEKIAVSQIQKIQFENVTGIEEHSKGASTLKAKGNYPNPFQEQTNIEFEIAASGTVIVIIYDNTGNRIQKLECQNCQTGKNNIQWNCLDANNNRVQSGIYYYEVRFDNKIQSKKMIKIK